MSVRFVWSKVSLKSVISLLIFYLDDLSIVKCGVLKSSTIIALLSIFVFRSVNNRLIYLGAQYWVHK